MLVLDGSLASLLLSLALALGYEIWALETGRTTVSAMVQKFGQQYRFVLVLVEVVILAALGVLGLHFLRVF